MPLAAVPASGRADVSGVGKVALLPRGAVFLADVVLESSTVTTCGEVTLPNTSGSGSMLVAQVL